MQRRELLTAAGGIGVAATAGCTSLGPDPTISNPSEQRESDGETTLQFQTDDGERIASLTVQPGKQRYSGSGGNQISVDVALTQRAETTVTGLELALRAPPGGAGSPAEVALKTPFGTPHPSIDLYAEPDDGGTVLAIDEMGESGDGTLVFQFLLTGLQDTTSELEIDVTAELTAPGVFGAEYTLTGLTLVALPLETNEAQS